MTCHITLNDDFAGHIQRFVNSTCVVWKLGETWEILAYPLVTRKFIVISQQFLVRSPYFKRLVSCEIHAQHSELFAICMKLSRLHAVFHAWLVQTRWSSVIRVDAW